MTTPFIRSGIAAVALTCLIAGGAAAESVKLRISTGFPSVHDVPTKLIAPWLDAVSEQSGVDVEMELFAAGSAFGSLDRQLTQVQKGLVDAAIGLAAVPRGRMPHLLLGDAPFLTADSATLQAAFDDIWDDIIQDFPDVRLVGVSIDCSQLHTSGKPVRELSDLAGLRIRVPSAVTADMIAAAGGIPVTMPQSEIYESLERNVIDGAITPWDVIEALKFGEVLKYHGDQNLFCGEMWFGFNQKKFDALPQSVKDAIEALDRLDYGQRAQALYAASSDSARAFAAGQGAEIVKLPEVELARWKELSQPAMEKYLAEAEVAGVSDIRAVYDRLQAAVAARAPH